ncbi:MAG: PilW family protein [Acidobacteriota bacterium]|nr:PilW family protein [Acidobacteriota bacterium]
MKKQSVHSQSATSVRSGGFTLLELLITLVMTTALMGAVAVLFQMNSRLASQQIQQADMQQSARAVQNELVRMVRMAGRGGLGRGNAPDFLAVSNRNKVEAADGNKHIAIGDATSPTAVDLTDVLTVRGVFNAPLYQVAQNAMTLAGTTGTLVVNSPGPTGVTQDLTALAQAIDGGINEPLIVVSGLSDLIYAVVELDHAGSSVDDPANPTTATLLFNIGVSGGTATKDKYMELSTGAAFSPSLRTTVFVGILEEYRYYIRENYQTPGDTSTPLAPRLSRARFLAGTELAHPSVPGFNLDIADGVLDLQVALGIDAGGVDGLLDEEFTNPTATDDWLFNTTADTPLDLTFWNGPVGGNAPDLFNVRISTLTRTGRPDPKLLSPVINRIEDRGYVEAVGDQELLYRRTLLSTVVDLRNQG